MPVRVERARSGRAVAHRPPELPARRAGCHGVTPLHLGSACTSSEVQGPDWRCRSSSRAGHVALQRYAPASPIAVVARSTDLTATARGDLPLNRALDLTTLAADLRPLC